MSVPTYGDLLKNASDLLKKKFDTDYKVTFKRSTACGLKIENSATSTSSGLKGNLKGTFKDKELGEVEFTAATTDLFTGQLKLTNLLDGLKATIKTTLGKKKDTDADFSVQLKTDYSQDNVTGRLDVVVGEYGEDRKVDFTASVVGGSDGINFGAQATSQYTDKFSSPVFDFGMSLVENDFTLGVQTLSKKDSIQGSIFQKLANGKRAIDFVYPANVATFANEYNLDGSTTLKSSISTSGAIQTAVEHTLSNPALKFNVATKFETTTGLDLAVQSHGVGITVGDL
jgi:hypothetical protein